MKPISASFTAKGTVWVWACLFSSVLLAAGVIGAEGNTVNTANTGNTGNTVVPDLHCVVMPSAVVDVSSGVSGRVETIHVERGDAVLSGQIVAALESNVEQANLVLARARAELETDIHLRKARLDFEQRKLKRTDQLHTSRVVSVSEQDEVETDARLAQWQLRKAIDDKYLAGLEMVRAAEVLKRRSVQSPIAGVVVERFKWPGEYVEEEPILRVARLDPLWVEVVAPVSLYGEVHRNMLAEVITETEGGEVREARVTVVDPMGDAASGTFRVRLELSNPDLSLLGGVKCKARFPDPARYAPEPDEQAQPEPMPEVEKAQINEPKPVPETRSSQRAASVVTPPAVERERPASVVYEAADSYIVVTPSLESDADRRRLAAELRASGINDFTPMRSGPFAGRISLGIYNGTRMAERRQSQLSALGFESHVMPRMGVEARAEAASGERAAALTKRSAARYDERG